MRELLKTFLTPYRGRAALGIALKGVEVVFDLITPMVVAYMIDAGVGQRDMGLVVRCGLVLLLLAAVGYVTTFVAHLQAAAVSQGVGTSVRASLYAHVMELDTSDVNRFGTPSLITRLTSDVNNVQIAVAMGVRMLIRWPFIALGSIVAALLIDARLGLIFCVCTPAIALFFAAVMAKSVPLYQAIQRQLDGLARLVRESLEGVRPIRAFGREGYETKRFDDAAAGQAASSIAVGKLSASLSPATFIIMNLGVTAILWSGAMRIQVGDLTQGELIAFVNYMTQLLLAIGYLANLVVIFMRGSTSATRIMEVLDTQPQITDGPLDREPGHWCLAHLSHRDTGAGVICPTGTLVPGSSVPPQAHPSHRDTGAEVICPTGTLVPGSSVPPGQSQTNADVSAEEWDTLPRRECPTMAFERVSFSYGSGAPALQDVSFTLPQGSTLGVIGGTGSGKSTLAQLAVRLFDPSEGTVSYDSVDVRQYQLPILRIAVSLVPQKASLLTGTIRDNLRWRNPAATDEELWEALERAQAADFVREKPGKLDERVEAGGSNFSGGQRQRLTIARALVGDPRVLVMDDSSSALDYATDARLRSSLKSLPSNPAIILISQRVASVMAADQILVLDHGRTAGLGTHQELVESCPIYREICLSQLRPEEVSA